MSTKLKKIILTCENKYDKLILQVRKRRIKMIITNEEQRLKEFKMISENWDRLPERAKGKLEGEIFILASLYCSDKKSEEKFC